MSLTRNPNLGPSQMRARKRRLFFVRLYIILFFLIIIIIGLAILSGHEGVKIKNISISGNAAVLTEEILNIVHRDIDGRYFYLFSKSNSLIFPRFRIRMDILNEIKTIKDVDISWKDWGKISIVIEERKPHSVWCGEVISELETECYFSDKAGYIYSQAPNFSGNLYVKIYGSLTSGHVENNINQSGLIGSYYSAPEKYSQIFSLIKILEQNNLKIVAISFDGFDYKFVLDDGPVIIFNNKNSFDVSFSNFLTAVQTGDLDLAKEASQINYIDLRFDNKIIIGKRGI